MPYSNPWDETVPTGAEDADQIDEFMRRLTKAVRERMDTLLGPNIWNGVDPILTLSERQTVPWVAGRITAGSLIAQANGGYCSPGAVGETLTLLIPFRLPTLAQITAIGFHGAAAGTSEITASLYAYTSDYLDQDLVGTVTSTAQGGYDGGTDDGLNFAVSGGSSFVMRVDMVTGTEFCHLISGFVQYTRPRLWVGT